LDFSPADANAGVLCYVDDSLVKQVNDTLAALALLQAQLAAASCQVSQQLNFGAWLASLNTFCSGNSCPTTTEPNLFTFLQANVAFSQTLIRQLNQ
jgi:hypothetical protein